MKRKPKQNKHPLYMKRTMTEKINVTFDFVRDNWRQWLKFSLYFLLPISVLQALGLNAIVDAMENKFPTTAVTITSLLYLLGTGIDTALMLLLLKWTLTHDDGLEHCDMAYLRHTMPKASLKCTLVWLIIVLCSAPVFIVAILGAIIFPFMGLIAFFALLPLTLVCPVYILEDNARFWTSFKRGFRLGFKRWGAIILVAAVMLVTVMILQNFVNIPTIIATIYKGDFSTTSSTESLGWHMALNIGYYVMLILYCFISYLGIAMFTLTIAYHYGSVVSDVEDYSLESEIDNFAQM